MDLIRNFAASINTEKIFDVQLLASLDAASFSDEILNKDDALCLVQVLSHCKDENKAKILGIIAELAKQEENRILLGNDDIFNLVLNEIENDDKDVTLQCFRAIGNICIENESGQSYILTSGHIERILAKFKTMAELSDEELGVLPRTAYGCVNNLSYENESLQIEMVKYGAIPIFYNCLKSFIIKDNKMAEIVLEALSGLAINDSAKEQIIELNMIGELLTYLQDCSDNVAVSILDALGELIQDDEMSEIICSDSSLLTLISAGAKRPSYNEKNSQDNVLKRIFDSLVIFTSNESFEANLDDKKLLNRLLELLNCENTYVQASGVLAIGNCAKNDITSTALVKLNTHIALIDFLKAIHGDEDSLNQTQAVLSTLKNIAIPVVNKPILSNTELPDIARSIVKSGSAVLQFKALAVLRLLVQGQSSLAVNLCSDGNFLQVVADCANRETVVGLCAEARRLTAALIKYCQSTESMDNLLRENGMRSLIRLLTSDHALMQNEALVAMATLLAALKDASKEFISAGGIEESKILLKQASNKPNVIFNVISLLITLSSDENGKKILQDSITDEMEKISNGPNELVKNQSLELLRILNG